MKQIHEAVQALEWHKILAAILDFVEEAEQGCNYQILMIAKMTKSEISAEIL